MILTDFSYPKKNVYHGKLMEIPPGAVTVAEDWTCV
jgi:hypothetical protein